MMRKSLLASALLLVGACSGPLSTPPPPGAYPARLYALGTEPFWSLDIDGTQIAYSTADRPDKVRAQAKRVETSGTLMLDGMLMGEALTVRVTRAACSDGMSDRTYPFTVAVRLGPQSLQGCASDRSPAN